jgi:signal recognition particle receptor subunit beta
MSKPANPLESKVIILGLSQSGKTSIRQVVFEGFAPKATSMNPATVRINRKLFSLAGGGINLYDIGGQTNYLNEIFQQYRDRTFSEVKAAIFVVDVSDAANIMRSKYYFDLTVNTISKIAPTARVYVFAHKMDVVPLGKRAAMVESIGDIFEIEKSDKISIMGTSIFHESIWEAMQKVLSYVYPRDDKKTTQIKNIVGKFDLEFLALSTSNGLVLYSQPEITSGLNLARLKTELAKTFTSGIVLEKALFYFGEFIIFVKELDEDLVVTAVFPEEFDLSTAQSNFEKLVTEIDQLFKPDELLGQAKQKMKQKLEAYLNEKNLAKVQDLETKLGAKIHCVCDICGKQIQKSILDVALENSEDLERGIKVTSGFGATALEIYPVHECVKGIREIPIILDNNLEYRRYEKSRPI